jgi:hypothetical protein
MAAELHLAEDTLALHFLLQHLKGLVDIVVTDENLHAAFLFDRAVDGADGQGSDHGARVDTLGCDGTAVRTNVQYSILCPPMATWRRIGETETSVRRRFLGSSSGQISACLYVPLSGRAGGKEQ